MTASRDRGRVVGAIDWLFRDPSSGRLVVIQWPNPALVVFVAARVGEWALGSDATASRLLQWLGTAALLWWSVGELARGVNPFRRMLGGVVLAALGLRLFNAALG